MGNKDNRNSKENKPGRIQKAVLLRTIIPMIIMGIIIAMVAYYGYKESIRSEIENSLTGVAASVAGIMDEAYPGDYGMEKDGMYISIYKGEKDITTDYTIVDRVKKETGIDVTLFYLDSRILTTLQNEYGERYIQTGINAGAYAEISKTKGAKCYLVTIDEVNYYACYLPLYNKDSSFTGIIGTAVKEKQIDDAAMKASFPIIIITLIAACITGFISFGYTNAMADSILKMRKFLSGMISGKLDNDMPGDVTRREDELGEAGKAIVDMQNAIRVLVERDPLTTLYNRRYGGARLRNVQKKANMYGVPYSVCICDIDFFKKVNDTYGHDAGDVVLKRVADIMKKSMAGKGFCARWGGEEFLLIFDKINMDNAVIELNRILETIRNTDINYGKLTIKITMSFGVVNGDNSDDYSELLRHADERLYLAKSNGRNRVVSTDTIEDMTEVAVEVPAKATENVVKTTENATETAVEKDLQEEFLTKLLSKMNEQLYNKTIEGKDDNNG